MSDADPDLNVSEHPTVRGGEGLKSGLSKKTTASIRPKFIYSA
jgi:hypothetical protein